MVTLQYYLPEHLAPENNRNATQGHTGAVERHDELAEVDVVLRGAIPKGMRKVQNKLGRKELINLRLKKYITLGKDRFRSNNFREALLYYQRALEIAPENTEIQFLIKKVELKQRDLTPQRKELLDENVVKVKFKHLTQKTTPSNTKSPVIESANPVALAAPIPSPTMGILDAPTIHQAINNDQIPGQPSDPSLLEPQMAIPLHPQDAKPKMDQITPGDYSGGEDYDTGEAITADDQTCFSCKGLGKCYWCDGGGTCTRCNGTGKEYNEKCPSCHGSGKCNSCGGQGTCLWCGGNGLQS